MGSGLFGLTSINRGAARYENLLTRLVQPSKVGSRGRLMSRKITFYYNPMSRARITYWMLEEIQADFEIKLLKWESGDHKSPEYLKINPMGKVPAIVHGETVITENPAILTYLADLYPEAQMIPPVGDPARGTYYRWMFFAAACLEPALMDKSFPRVQPPAPSRLGYGSYDDTVNTLEKAVSNGFILGDRFSAADVFISSQIGWALMNKDIEPRPAFLRYQKHCTDRPGYRRFTEKTGALD